MDPLRAYEGWWYYGEETLEATKKENPSTEESSETLDYQILDGKNLAQLWLPFRTRDHDRLEQGFHEPSQRDLSPTEMVVHDKFGLRLSKVSYERMKMTTIYWDGPVSPIRRSIWVQMLSEDEAHGGLPLPMQADLILEKIYEAHKIWIEDISPFDSSDSIIEKIIPLPAPLSYHVLVLRRGALDTASMLHVSVLEDKRSSNAAYVRRKTIYLVRGYPAYHIRVLSAFRKAEAERHTTHIILKNKQVNSKNDETEENNQLKGEEFIKRQNKMVPALELASPFEEPDFSTPIAPKSLILYVHGIGQKLYTKLGYNFIDGTAKFRESIVKTSCEKHGLQVGDIIVLPVIWRSSLQMTTRYFSETDSCDAIDDSNFIEANFEDLVSRITLDNIPAIRDIASDLGLDILLYMTPLYFKRILRATINDVKRIYSIFLKVAGLGATRTRISFVGHSLGGAIVSDLLAFIPPSSAFLTASLKKNQNLPHDQSNESNSHDQNSRNDSRTTDRISNGSGYQPRILGIDEEEIARHAESLWKFLGFSVDKFFALGSPVAAFLLLKQIKPYGCFGDSSEQVTRGEMLDPPTHHESVKPGPNFKNDDSRINLPKCIPNSEKSSSKYISSECNVEKLELSTYPEIKQPITMIGEEDILEPQRMVYACSQIFNIFHPTDPVAYRIEPLIVSSEEMRHLHYAVRLPYTKSGVLQFKRQMEEGIQRLQQSASKARGEMINSFSRSLSSIIGSRSSSEIKSSDTGLNTIDAPESTFGLHQQNQKKENQNTSKKNSRLYNFNRHGRVDFSLEDAIFENAYLSAISSHFCYWDDQDIISFIASECCATIAKDLATIGDPDSSK